MWWPFKRKETLSIDYDGDLGISPAKKLPLDEVVYCKECPLRRKCPFPDHCEGWHEIRTKREQLADGIRKLRADLADAKAESRNRAAYASLFTVSWKYRINRNKSIILRIVKIHDGVADMVIVDKDDVTGHDGETINAMIPVTVSSNGDRIVDFSKFRKDVEGTIRSCVLR